MEDIKDIKHYQDLSFETLHNLIEKECRKGNSKINLDKYHIGYKMRKYLENKGFVFTLTRSGDWMSW